MPASVLEHYHAAKAADNQAETAADGFASTKY